jgi:hypothetical protein
VEGHDISGLRNPIFASGLAPNPCGFVQTTEEEELTRAVGEKRVEYSRLHVVLLERMQQMQDVGHVYRKMCLEQDWEEFERLQAERREKQVRVSPGFMVSKKWGKRSTSQGLGTRVLSKMCLQQDWEETERLQVEKKEKRINEL